MGQKNPSTYYHALNDSRDTDFLNTQFSIITKQFNLADTDKIIRNLIS